MNANAAIRTNMRVEDLHIATDQLCATLLVSRYVLYRLRVMVLSDKFDNPISPPVEIAVGITLILNIS